jgi:hypothetical protein
MKEEACASVPGLEGRCWQALGGAHGGGEMRLEELLDDVLAGHGDVVGQGHYDGRLLVVTEVVGDCLEKEEEGDVR